MFTFPTLCERRGGWGFHVALPPPNFPVFVLVTILDSDVFCDSKALVALSTTPAPLNMPQRSCSVGSTKRERAEKQVLRAAPANAGSLSSAWRRAPGLAIADGRLPEARQGDYECSSLIITSQVLISRLVGSNLRTCHRFWSDYGLTGSYSGPEVRFGELRWTEPSHWG
jgi:hypothetical protein